jgi:universal stress protein A
MMAVRQILVPIDFSAPSRAALTYAVALAERLGATLEVLHVWEPPRYVGPEAVAFVPADVAHPDWEEVRQRVRTEVERLVASVGGASPARVRVVPGAPRELIPEVAAEIGAELVIMGTHGRSGLARVFLGSVAEAVVRHAPCPVLTLRAPPRGAGEREEREWAGTASSDT